MKPWRPFEACWAWVETRSNTLLLPCFHSQGSMQQQPDVCPGTLASLWRADQTCWKVFFLKKESINLFLSRLRRDALRTRVNLNAELITSRSSCWKHLVETHFNSRYVGSLFLWMNVWKSPGGGVYWNCPNLGKVLQISPQKPKSRGSQGAAVIVCLISDAAWITEEKTIVPVSDPSATTCSCRFQKKLLALNFFFYESEYSGAQRCLCSLPVAV